MKKIILLCVMFTPFLIQSINVTSKKTEPISVVIMGIGKEGKELSTVCNTIKKDLSFTGQFVPAVKFQEKVPSSKQIKSWSKEYPLFVGVTEKKEKKCFEWRLYDTKKVAMVTGKASPKRGAVSDWGHQISDGLLRALTGNKGFFTTKITYCKDRVKNKTDICISDYDGSNEKVVRSLDTLAIAPRWNADSHKPLILYSEYTATNVRLVVSDLKGNAQVATSFDGLNMLPAFSKNGKQVIMCLSTEGSSQLYKYSYNARKKKTSYIALTNNDGNNISPTVLDDGDIVFCSDFETKRPQIYRMNKKGKNLTRLTDGGFCTSPVYSSEKNKIAYVKIVKGRGQIMTYNFDTEEHKQITSDALHKEECSWSSCGNYIMFSTDNGKSKRLAVYNILTNKRTFLGSGTSDKTYPAWSAYPVYSIS